MFKLHSVGIHSLCDDHLISSMKNALTDDSKSLSMAETNESYMTVMKQSVVENSETGT